MFSEIEDSATGSAEPTDDSDLIRQIQNADSIATAFRARNALIERHLDLVDRAVRSTVPTFLASYADDARQEASCALIEIASSFDPNRASSFRTYATVVMVRRINAYLCRHRHAAEGEWFGRQLGKLRKFLAQDGRAPDEISDVQFAVGTGLPLLAVRRLRPWLNSPVELDALVERGKHEDDGGLDERVPGPDLPASETLSRADALGQIRQMVNALGLKDRHLLTRVFGLDGDEPATVAEASAGLGLRATAGAMRLRRAMHTLRQRWRD